jgi:class 3 adenylate cyclase
MARLPSGTVTLLFSDIEGSTGLLRRLGPTYEALLMEHRRLPVKTVQPRSRRPRP